MRKCIDYIVHAAYVFRANRSVAIIESPLATCAGDRDSRTYGSMRANPHHLTDILIADHNPSRTAHLHGMDKTDLFEQNGQGSGDYFIQFP